ncbi:MAG: MFS transporter [Deltaproteobacteria bacterium]|nr:MFS transporter [Deltaproteobacteria bacterium]
MAEQNSYRWYILAASFLILVIDGGVRFSFGVLIKPLVSEFSWERGAITLAYTLNMLVFACCQPLAGKLLDRFGPKRLFTVSALVTSAGLAFTSQTMSLWDLYWSYGVVVAAGISGISIAVVASVLSRWFTELRVFMSGVAISGTALGQFLFIPLIALLLENFGWRWTWTSLGMLLSLVVVPLSLLVIKNNPAENEPAPTGAKKVSHDSSPGVYAVLTSRNFLLVGASYFVCGFQDFLFVTQMIPFATDQGLAAQEASNLQGLAGLLSIPGLLIFAAVSEKLGRKIPLFLTFVPRFVCFALLIFFDGRFWIYASALLFGFTLMGLAPLGAALVGELYGFKHIGTLTGVIFWVHHLGGALGAYLGGVTHDLTRSYSMVFSLAMILAFAALLTSASIRAQSSPPPNTRDRRT